MNSRPCPRRFLEKLVNTRRNLFARNIGRQDWKIHRAYDRVCLELRTTDPDLVGFIRNNRHLVADLIPGGGFRHSLKWTTELNQLCRL